jgi:ATP/ADP translocase
LGGGGKGFFIFVISKKLAKLLKFTIEKKIQKKPQFSIQRKQQKNSEKTKNKKRGGKKKESIKQS